MSSRVEFLASLDAATRSLNAVGFSVESTPGKYPRVLLRGEGRVTLYEAGTGWIPGIYRLGIIAGIYGQKGWSSGSSQHAFKKAEQALSRRFKLVGTAEYSKLIQPR